jgi:hypothetical protein
VANPGGSAFSPRRARVKVSRVFRKQVLTCSNSLVSAKPPLWEAAEEAERPYNDAGLLSSVVYRPTIFCRNEIGWIAAFSRCAAAEPDAMRAAKSAEVR